MASLLRPRGSGQLVKKRFARKAVPCQCESGQRKGEAAEGVNPGAVLNRRGQFSKLNQRLFPPSGQGT